MSELTKLTIVTLIYFIVIFALTSCGKSDYRYSPHCAEPQDVGNKCVHMCNGEWARKIETVTLYFETEGDCLK